MKTNRELPLAVKRALATGTLALCGAGSVAAYATPATATQPNAIPVTTATTSTVTTATTSTVTTATTSTATTATTSKTTFANAAVPKTATAKTTDAKQPIALAQATVLPQPSSSGTVAAPELQTVVVTGTLIARPAAETAEAITVIRADTLKSMGITNVEEAMNTLTNNVPTVNISSAVGSFSGGGTYADLRGLGNGRTLVLLDGQRLANNANTGNAVDLSGIPFSAIDSIQVLREGASALYGSDAIAGVVNFITKRDYQGGEIRLNVDHPQEAGGRSGYANFTIGHGDLLGDGYNAMLTASYSRQDELRAGQRSFTAEGYYPSLGVTQTNNPGTWPASILDANGGLWQPGFPACAGNPYLTTDQGNCAYRYSAATDLIPKSTEASALASLTKALPANNTVQLQYLYSRSTVTAWAGPMFYAFEMTRQADPAYYPTSAAGLTCEANCNVAPDLTDPIVAEWTDPNNNRITGDTNTEQRALVTFSGDNGGWGYKLNLNYSENRSAQTNNGDIPDEAVLAPTVDPNSGLPILSNLINPFGPQSAAGQALIERSYISGTFENGRMKRWSIDGNANHSLGDAFDAGTPATLALGFSLEGDNFSAASTPYNDLVHAATGFSDTSIEGSRTAQAVFVELDVPVSKSLDLDVSDREDRYSDFGRTNNGKVTVRYQPSHYLTFRGAASTGFRAPTLFDLYSPNNMEASSSGTMGTGNPFCQPGSYNAEWTQTACASQGLGLFGGNKQLTPETSQNFDLGVVVAPIRNLGITLDYYRINLKNTIGAIPSSAIYGDPTAFASDIHTNDAGTLTPSIDQASICTPYTLPGCGYIILTSQNTGAITTNGVDVSVQYLQHTALGTFKEDLEGTSVTQYRLQLYNGGPILNLVGWNQAGNLNPPAFRWQHELRLDWTGPDGIWGAGLSNRFYSSYIDQFPINSAGTQRIVGSQSTWDGYASYKPISTLTLLVGIQNLFNTNPPFTNAQQNNFAAGYSALFSNPLLRTFYVNLTYKFL